MRTWTTPALGVWVALALGCGLSRPVGAQDFRVRSWHVDDGLPDGTVTALAQTPDGFLWVGTRKGLVRFDGVRFANDHWRVRQASPADGVLAGHPPPISGEPHWFAFSPLASDGEGVVWGLHQTNSLLRR